jgi:hypothetical protein|nr:MAG TPA: hypothetical protein [Caudoviricetes sp.]
MLTAAALCARLQTRICGENINRIALWAVLVEKSMVREYFQTHANTMCNRMAQRGGGKHLVST